MLVVGLAVVVGGILSDERRGTYLRRQASDELSATGNERRVTSGLPDLSSSLDYVEPEEGGRIGWVVVPLKRDSDQSSVISDRNSSDQITDYRLQMTTKWPGVVLVKREGEKLKVRVGVGVPGIAEGNSASSLKPLAFSLEPEWWEGETELKGVEEIDYVFLKSQKSKVNLPVYLRRQAQAGSQNRAIEYGVGECKQEGKCREWTRVGYFPIISDQRLVISDEVSPSLATNSHQTADGMTSQVGESLPDLSRVVIEVKGGRIDKRKGSEVWTELVDEGKLAFSLKPLAFSLRQEASSKRQEAIWYPVWDGNDLMRHGNKQAKNCDVLGRGKVETKEVHLSQNRLRNTHLVPNEVTNLILDAVDYRAEGYGVNCDYIPYERYGGFDNYVLVVEGENLAGRSLKVYGHTLDKEGRTVLEELVQAFSLKPLAFSLRQEASSKRQFKGVYPIMARGNRGLVVNLETRSFGRVASENVVRKVLLIPIGELNLVLPQNRLRNTHLLPNEVTNPILDKNSKLTYKKIGTGLYVISFTVHRSPFTAEKPLVLSLSQGYEKGWGAWEISWSQNRLSRQGGTGSTITNLILGWLPRVRMLKHVRVEGWKNGWVVPPRRDSDQLSVISDQGDANQITDDRLLITIFYWPQVLEWVGLGLLVVGFGCYFSSICIGSEPIYDLDK